MDESNVIQFWPQPRPLPQEIELDEEFEEWFSLYETIILIDYIREDCRELDSFELLSVTAPEVVLSLILKL